MFARFQHSFNHALRLLASIQQDTGLEGSIAKRGSGFLNLRSALLFVAATSFLHIGVEDSVAQIPPCSDEQSCDYRLPPITDPRELVQQADHFAVTVLGYRDRNENGIPDFRERYHLGINDCSTVSAQFDDILEQMGVLGVLNSQQASGAGQIRDTDLYHAYNYVPEIGYMDLTPGHGPSLTIVTEVGPGAVLYVDGYPDENEYIDPAYSGPQSPSPDFQVPPLIPRPSEIPSSLSPEGISREIDEIPAPNAPEIPESQVAPQAPQAP